MHRNLQHRQSYATVVLPMHVPARRDMVTAEETAKEAAAELSIADPEAAFSLHRPVLSENSFRSIRSLPACKAETAACS